MANEKSELSASNILPWLLYELVFAARSRRFISGISLDDPPILVLAPASTFPHSLVQVLANFVQIRWLAKC
jgi:hypothetical protein